MPKGVPNPKVNKASPKWFYLEDVLHERIHVNRAADKMRAWNYDLNAEVIYSNSSVKLRLRPAYTTRQAGAMLNRAHLTMLRYIEWGEIKPPKKGIRDVKLNRPTAYRWSDADILAAHDFLCNERGQASKRMMTPTRRELKALLNNEQVLYVQNADGNFLPTWRAKEF